MDLQVWRDESQMPMCLEELYAYECEAEENQGARASDKASKAKCERVLGARRAAKYGSIGMLGRAMGKGLCEAEENEGAGAGDKASKARRAASMEELWENDCVNLKSIRGLEQLTKLRLLDVGGSPGLEELPSTESLASLQELWVVGCVKLKGSVRLCRSFESVCSC